MVQRSTKGHDCRPRPRRPQRLFAAERLEGTFLMIRRTGSFDWEDKPLTGSIRTLTVDEVMTPRSMLYVVSPDRLGEAAYIADQYGFDAVPIVSEGEIHSYWSRRSRRERRIARSQRVSYKQSLAAVLARLVRHGVHFVQYDSQVVGLVDLSDLNKPNARTLFMEPLLALEQSW
jgi:CBS domain-containing protein